LKNPSYAPGKCPIFNDEDLLVTLEGRNIFTKLDDITGFLAVGTGTSFQKVYNHQHTERTVHVK